MSNAFTVTGKCNLQLTFTHGLPESQFVTGVRFHSASQRDGEERLFLNFDWVTDRV